MSKVDKPSADAVPDITRRDFMGATLLGAGSALLTMAPPSVHAAANAAAKPGYALLGPDWTGPGGIGDYAHANGNTHTTVNAAHALRDGYFNDSTLPAPTEEYDLVVVGSGISGLASSYEFLKGRNGKAKILVLDNNAIFGGEAKENELLIDGYRLQAPQGSNMFLWPAKVPEKLNFFWNPLWRELGLPMGDEPDAPKWLDAENMVLPKNHYSAMMIARENWPQAQFYPDPDHRGRWKFALSPWKNGYQDLPWPEEAKQQLARLDKFSPEPREDLEAWMDSMTYKEYLTKVVGITRKEVFDYLDPMIASYGTGMGCDAISAQAARDFIAPGTTLAEERARIAARRSNPELSFEAVSFPGGNAGIARHLMKRLIPDAIAGGNTLKDIIYGEVKWDALDRPNQSLRVRCSTTVVDVRHEAANANGLALVSYIDNESGKMSRVRAKAVIMASGQWVNKRVVRDAPQDILTAMDQFNHAPMLIVNVGLRNWRFVKKLGAPTMRWHGGFGWFTNIRGPMSVDNQHMPVDPDKPAVLTFYIPFTSLSPVNLDGSPVRVQCITARTGLFTMSYRDIEQRIRTQLKNTFAPYGFDDKRDIAAIITNRWGHAYVTPEVGFFYGKNGQPSARDVVRKGYGRIRFGHSELSGVQLWSNACGEGVRAAKQALELV